MELPIASRTRRALVPALALSWMCACSATQEKPVQDVNWLVQHGHYEKAVTVAAERHQRAPDDPEAERDWRLASVALLLDEGRRLSFQNRDVEALERFEQALELGPDVEQARHWREAELDKLATQWVLKAIDWHASDNLPEAEACYEKALAYRPEDPRAKSGLGRILISLNYRRGMGEKYYEQGIQALEQYLLDQAAHHFSSTEKYDELNERATQRRISTDTLRAETRVLAATDFEDQGQYAAARNEYRLALLFDPEYGPALEGLERTKKEERASELMRECERRIIRRQFVEAEKALAEGAALTEHQAEAFAAERDRLQIARTQVRYESARALETDHRFEEAIVVYDEIIGGAPQGYQDSFARRDTLIDMVGKATDYYSQAQASSDPAEQLALLRQVLVVYPEYKDTQSWAARLEAELAEPADDGEEPPR